MTIYCYLHHPPWIWKSHYSSAFAQSIVCISYRICQVLTYLGNLSLYMADNLNVAFFGKILSNMSWQENCATFMSGNQYDRLSQQSFLSAAASLSNSSTEKSINTTERQPKEQVQYATKISLAHLSSTQLDSAKFIERLAHRSQLKFLTQPVPQTVVQLHRIDN